MTRSTPVPRPSSWVAVAISSYGLSLLAATAGWAAPQPDSFPPAETFRNLQLISLSCSRDNTASSCDKARALANPLLDHPRLPTSCKDVLWAINQQAYPAESNSPDRRDRLDRSARELMVFCRPQIKPTAKGDSKSGSPFGSSGGTFGFGSPQPQP